MKKCLLLAPDGRVDSVCEYDDTPVPLPDGMEGPPAPGENPPSPEGFTVVDAPSVMFDKGWPKAPTFTSVLYLIDGTYTWIETALLSDLVVQAVDHIDSAADKVRQAIVSKQTNTEEYKRSEQQAREYKTAGYPADAAPSCVASWAKAKYRDGWTAQMAADDIIATADRWYALLDAIRDLRLCAKEDVRNTASGFGVTARVQQFDMDLYNLTKDIV